MQKVSLESYTLMWNLLWQMITIKNSNAYNSLCSLLLITSACPPLDRVEGLLVSGNISWRAWSPSWVVPSRGRYPATLRHFRNFLRLCYGVWRERWHHFLQRQVQRAYLQVKPKWHWCEITYYYATLLDLTSIIAAIVMPIIFSWFLYLQFKKF